MRRHLTTTQLSTIGVEMLPMLKEEAKKRQATSTGGAHPQLSTNLYQAEKGKAVAQAAKIVGTGTTVIYEAPAREGICCASPVSSERA